MTAARLQDALQPGCASVRRGSYLYEQMFAALTARLVSGIDLLVEFATLGEYTLAGPVADPACESSAVRRRPRSAPYGVVVACGPGGGSGASR